MIEMSVYPHLSPSSPHTWRDKTFRTLSFEFWSFTAPFRVTLSHQLHPLFGSSSSAFISSLLTFCVCVSPTYHHSVIIVVSSIPRRSFLAFLSHARRFPAIHVTLWKSLFKSWVNEFAITIFHVDVTTYSHVDFGIPPFHLRRVRITTTASASLHVSCTAM